MVSINAERSYPVWGNSVRRIGRRAMLQGAVRYCCFLCSTVTFTACSPLSFFSISNSTF